MQFYDNGINIDFLVKTSLINIFYIANRIITFYPIIQCICFCVDNQESALSQFRKTGEKTVTMGYKLDMIFHQIRLGLFYMDHDLIKRNLEKAQRYKMP